MKKILVYDTTLRDGEQAPGNEMSLEQKKQLFNQIDALGVDYIDVGFPASSSMEFEACQYFARTKRNAAISALARANENDLAKAITAVDHNKNAQIQILLLGSEIHVKNKRGITLREAIDEAITAIRFVKQHHITDISVALEDASRAHYDYLQTLIKACVQEGATTIVIPDTLGALIPEEAYELISTIRKWVGPNIKISIHCHNDMGLATANTLSAIQAGVDCIQTTLCGVGERAGNAAIEEILTTLSYKKSFYQVDHQIDLKQLHQVCHVLINTIKLSISKHKPIIGENVFATAAGIHIHGLLKDPVIYEFIKSNDYNQKQSLKISRNVGRSAIRNKLQELKLDYDEALVDWLCDTIKNSESPSRYDDEKQFLELYQSCTSTVLT